MKKDSFFILIILFLTACSSKNEGNVTLQVLNEEIYFSGNHEYRYPTNESREKSKTLLSFKLSNNTDENYLFFIDDDLLLPTPVIQKETSGFLYLQIKEGNKVKVCTAPLSTPSNFECFYYQYQLYKDSIKDIKYKQLKRDLNYEERYILDMFLKKSFVLHPKESKTIKVMLSLPIVQEYNPAMMEDTYYYTNLKQNQKFQAHYACDSAKISKNLPDFLLHEMRENNTKIFHGVLISEEVPLKEKK